MRDPNVTPELRIKVAQAAAPFAHAKPARGDPGDPAVRAMLIEGTSRFTIDPAVAKALRDDQERLNELVRNGSLVSAAEVEAESELRASIADRAKAIGCPEGYGPRDARNDSNRLHQIQNKRHSPPSCGGARRWRSATCASLACIGESHLVWPMDLEVRRLATRQDRPPSHDSSLRQGSLRRSGSERIHRRRR